MGADEFSNKRSAKSATEAFRALVEEALYEEGHGGYTGTIAEKSTFEMEDPWFGETPAACLKRCRNDEGHWSNDKRGPAACVDLGPDSAVPGNRIFVFFGLAPS
jgi:hypothetical protein